MGLGLQSPQSDSAEHSLSAAVYGEHDSSVMPRFMMYSKAALGSPPSQPWELSVTQSTSTCGAR